MFATFAHALFVPVVYSVLPRKQAVTKSRRSSRMSAPSTPVMPTLARTASADPPRRWSGLRRPPWLRASCRRRATPPLQTAADAVAHRVSGVSPRTRPRAPVWYSTSGGSSSRAKLPAHLLKASPVVDGDRLRSVTRYAVIDDPQRKSTPRARGGVRGWRPPETRAHGVRRRLQPVAVARPAARRPQPRGRRRPLQPARRMRRRRCGVEGGHDVCRGAHSRSSGGLRSPPACGEARCRRRGRIGAWRSGEHEPPD